MRVSRLNGRLQCGSSWVMLPLRVVPEDLRDRAATVETSSGAVSTASAPGPYLHGAGVIRILGHAATFVNSCNPPRSPENGNERLCIAGHCGLGARAPCASRPTPEESQTALTDGQDERWTSAGGVSDRAHISWRLLRRKSRSRSKSIGPGSESGPCLTRRDIPRHASRGCAREEWWASHRPHGRLETYTAESGLPVSTF